jgi:IS5 family transposase
LCDDEFAQTKPNNEEPSMPSIAELPAIVISALNENREAEAALWAWLSEQYYATLVAQNRDHLLVFVKACVDFAPLERACEAFHVYGGQRGQAPTYSNGQLCRALLVKGLYGWSYRRLESELRSHNLVRWFVGCGLCEPTLDHVTLWRFGTWVQQHAPRVFFDETLRQLYSAQPSEREQAQAGDTFALLSRAKEQSRTEMLRDASRRLLNYLAAVTPSATIVVRAELNEAALFGTATECPEHYLEKAERDALEVRTATAAHECLRLVSQQRQALGAGSHTQRLEYQALLRWEGVLAKILRDEFTITRDEQGRARTVSHPSHKQKGAYRHGSMVDLDATFRCHGDKCQLGYNAHVAVTQNFITEIYAMPGAAPDSVGVAGLIAHQQEHQHFVPPKLIYDRAAGMPKIFAEVAQASDGQTQLVAKLIDYGKNRTRFGPADFTLNAVGQLSCPNGQIAAKSYPSASGDGINYRFLPEQCHGCPLLDHCRGDPVRPDKYRQVFISHYTYFQRAAIAYTTTDAFRADMKLRPAVERIIAALVRYNGARRATAYGLAAADFQLKMAAVAYNLKRWHTLTKAKEQAQRSKPPPHDDA